MVVYLSYDFADTALANRIAQGLRADGIEVWDPAEEVFPGDNFAAVIGRGLEKSDAMVVVLSPGRLQYQWGNAEVAYALGKRAFQGRLIPVLTRPHAEFRAGDIPWILEKLPMVDFYDVAHEGDSVSKISSALRTPAVQLKS